MRKIFIFLLGVVVLTACSHKEEMPKNFKVKEDIKQIDIFVKTKEDDPSPNTIVSNDKIMMIADALENAEPISPASPVSDIGHTLEMELLYSSDASNDLISVWIEQNMGTGRFEVNGVRFKLHEDCVPEFSKLQVKNTFIAKIDKIWKTSAHVTVIESNGGLTKGTETSVDLSVNKDAAFQVGDTIEVGYDGSIFETYPPQIITITVEKTD